MARSRYPSLNRVLREVQEVTGVSEIDGLIGPSTERAVAKALAGYDGNDVLGYLSDLPHRLVVASAERKIEKEHNQPPWLIVAKRYLGLEEIKGGRHNAKILRFWKRCGLPFRDDETPWCAGFVGGVLEECGIRSSRSGMARSYLKWGEECECRPGAIVVFWRGSIDSASGHVGFVVSPLGGDFVATLGGNQGDRVCVKGYPKTRVLGYRKPVGLEL